MNAPSTFVTFLLLAQGVSAATPKLDDYARGVTVDAAAGLPLVEATLPDVVYSTVTRADLGDVRVFNADGVAIPHAFCAAPKTLDPVITEQELPVFELRDAAHTGAEGSRIEVQTAGGTQVHVHEAGTDVTAPSGRTHIIDVREHPAPLRAIQFDWASPDGASEVKVRIEASEDLDRWTVIVPGSTLLRATRGAEEIRRERIEVPARHYEYLRVERVDGGEPLRINAVIAELVAEQRDVEPQWFMPDALASKVPESMLFDAARVAPVRYARLRLPQDNSSVRVAIESRADENGVWREHWSGESYVIVTQTERRESPPARFEPTTDRYWRVRIVTPTAAQRPTSLELGYLPARLRFLAQGPAPYTVAFGSRRADVAAPAACNGLLGDVSAKDRKQMIVQGYVGAVRNLGGELAFTPLPKQTPLRLIVLWSVLVGGVALLVAMSLSLLRRLRHPSTPGF
jgi:Protein of unknown function (DUF3999)